MIVVWRITELCNLACSFCAYDRRLPFPRATADLGEVERFGQLLAEWKTVSGGDLLVSWLGGEPLLLNSLRDTTRRFVETHGLRVSTTTNGTSLDRPEIREHLLRYYCELTISVDAVGPQHDQLRGMPGLFEKVRNGTIALAREKRGADARLKLRANVVLMRNTFAAFPELCRELADWGIEEISFNNLGGRDRPEFFPENRLTPAQTNALPDLVDRLRCELRPRGISLTGSPEYLQRMSAAARNQAVPVADCGPGETFLFIDERGRVSPCSFTSAEYGVSLREIQSAAQLSSLPGVFRQSRGARCAEPCRDCMSTHVFTKFSTAYGNRGSATRNLVATNR